MTPNTDNLNCLVFNFDLLTGWRFDTIAEPAWLVRLAEVLPEVRRHNPTLGDELRTAFARVRQEKGELCD